MFQSILFENTRESSTRDTMNAPTFFKDLALDQIIDSATAGREEYNFKSFFYRPLHDVDAIAYRQEIFRDLEEEPLYRMMASFANKMRAMREHLLQADKLYYPYQKERWFLEAVSIYCDAVTGLAQEFPLMELKSRGFLAFREYVTCYIESDRFTSLRAETKKLIADLAAVRYCLHIQGSRIQVRHDESETDYSAEVEKTFGKFKQGAVTDYRTAFFDRPDMNHVEAQILDFVARLYPKTFSDLDRYYHARNGNYLDETIGVFDREVQFYLAYLEQIAPLKREGLPFCYPEISDTDKEVYVHEGFDMALALKLMGEGSTVVCNDFHLYGEERIIVVTGPNQGGKTTFARMFGQLHYLACLGCPVPGRKARLFLFDRIFSHFEREENIDNLRGKLQDDLVRIHQALSSATPRSILIINEIFTTTTLRDAAFLGRAILGEIMQLDALCAYVTFVDELSSLSEKTVSMVSTVAPDNPVTRTYKIVRRPADGRSYAISLAEKYRLTHACLKERIRS